MKAAAVGFVVAIVAKGLILTGGGTAFTQYQQFSQTKSGLCSV